MSFKKLREESRKACIYRVFNVNLFINLFGSLSTCGFELSFCYFFTPDSSIALLLPLLCCHCQIYYIYVCYYTSNSIIYILF